MFLVFAIIFVVNNNIVLSKLIVVIWKHYNISTVKSDESTNKQPDNQKTSMLAKLTWKRNTNR